jgi:hypothetical protein
MQKKAWVGAKKRPLWKQGPKPKLTAYEKNLFFTLNTYMTFYLLKSIQS